MNTRKMDLKRYDTGVLVIGGGGAALRAALAARSAGAEVLLLTKGSAGKGGATYYSVAEIGAYNVPDASIDPSDSPEIFYEDIMRAALGTANAKLAQIVAEEAASTKTYLEECGMRYARNEDGSYMGYRACFSSKARSLVVENHFKPIAAALGARVCSSGVQIMENAVAVDLIVHNGICVGAFAIQADKLFCIRASAVILATGGASTLFRHHMYPPDVTGDGYAMAHRAGAKLCNLEFIQAGIGLSWPEVNLFGNQLWEAMPRLTNGNGRRFIHNYVEAPFTEADAIRGKGGHFPFSCRDESRFVEIAIQREIRGGTPTKRGNIYLDFAETDFPALFSRPDSRLNAMWPLTYERFQKFGIDLYKDKIEIACFAHAINGGILIDADAQSSVPGLYAAGEVAAGPHGADRLGGNMSVTCQVFGRRAGEAAARKAAVKQKEMDLSAEIAGVYAFLDTLGRLDSAEQGEVRDVLQGSADESLLIVRHQESLTAFLQKVRQLRTQTQGARSDQAASIAERLELENLFTSAELIAQAALQRKESRGSHYRCDFPEMDESLANPLIL